MRVIVVGAGGIARELLRRLGESWDVTLVDTSVARLASIDSPRTFRSEIGDGSSRIVLTRAGIEQADALIAATNDDDTNLEIARLGQSLGVPRLAAVAADPEHAARYRALGITAISPDSLAARRIELVLETRRLASMAFADGRAEAIEFRLAPDSPVRGKRLAELHATSWIVGALLRDDRLIIPHGDTVLEAGDRVTVVGAGSEFAEIVRTFTSGEGRFPLDFGKRIAVAIRDRTDVDGPLAEAAHLVRNSRASSLVVVHRDPNSVRDEIGAGRIRALVEMIGIKAGDVELRVRAVRRSHPARALAGLPAEESVGVLVVPAGGSRSLRARWRAYRAVDLVNRTRRPVLLSRGSVPYARIVVPARRSPAGRAAIRAAIDLGRFSKSSVEGLAVVDPVFIAGPDAEQEARAAVEFLREEAAVHGVDARGVILRGNPVRTFAERAADTSLLVLAVAVRRGPPLRRLRLAGMVAARVPCSVLLVPATRWD